MELLEVGRIEKNPRWQQPTHKHTYLQVICFHEGRGYVWLDGRAFRPRAGSILIYRPGAAHREVSDERAPQRTVYLGIDRADWISRSDSHLWDGSGSIRWLSQGIWAEAQNDPAGRRSKLAQAYLNALAIHLERAPAVDSAPSSAADWLVEARAYIEAHFWQVDLDREAIALAVGVGVSTLAHGFGRRFGLGVREYLERVRMEAAARRLREGSPSIQDVAFAVGYTDPFHFSRVFRRCYGVPPIQYRRLKHE